MDSDGFYEAAIPEPFRVLGLRLRPLSMGHLILLHRIGSPYIAEASEAENGNAIGNLAIAALVCSMTFQEGVELLNTPDLGRQIAAWGRRIRKPHWWSREQKIDWAEKHQLFADYIRHSTDLPGHYWTREDGFTVQAPYVQIIKVQLMLKLHFTEAELMDRPWRLCLWDMLTVRALEGDLRFVDTGDIEEAQARANEMAAKMKERMGNGAT